MLHCTVFWLGTILDSYFLPIRVLTVHYRQKPWTILEHFCWNKLAKSISNRCFSLKPLTTFWDKTAKVSQFLLPVDNF